MRELTGCGIHHTASIPEITFQTVERWHKAKVPPWSEIGYHEYIDDQGVVWDGRRRQKMGAQMKRQNRHTIGICVAGDNTVDGRKWNSAQITALCQRVLSWHEDFPSMVFGGHRDFPFQRTACPGLDIEDFLRVHGVHVPIVGK